MKFGKKKYSYSAWFGFCARLEKVNITSLGERPKANDLDLVLGSILVVGSVVIMAGLAFQVVIIYKVILLFICYASLLDFIRVSISKKKWPLYLIQPLIIDINLVINCCEIECKRLF